MNAQLNSNANDYFDDPLQSMLEQALQSSIEQRALLRQPERLGEILNSVPHRRWLFEQAQTDDRHRALKARSLIIFIMQYSGKLWRGDTAAIEDYREAEAQTWNWFSENLHKYDPLKGSFVTWFNFKLKCHLSDLYRDRQKKATQEQPLFHEDGEDAAIEVPDPNPCESEAQIFYEQIVNLVQRDPGNSLRNCCMHNHLHVTCRAVILAILQAHPTSPNIPWQALADQFEVERDKFRDFCNHTAFPHFRLFCKQQGVRHL